MGVKVGPQEIKVGPNKSVLIKADGDFGAWSTDKGDLIDLIGRSVNGRLKFRNYREPVDVFLSMGEGMMFTVEFDEIKGNVEDSDPVPVEVPVPDEGPVSDRLKQMMVEVIGE